jgi:hypothetical protein
MSEAGANGPLAQSVRELLERSAVEKQESQTFTRRLSSRLATIWNSLTRHRLFRRGVFAVLILAGALSAAEVAWLLRHGLAHLAFSQKAFMLTTLVADAALLVGALRLRHSLLSALHWYDHAVLIEITVAQVFLYTSEQLAATLNLAALLILWSLIRWGIHFETAQRAKDFLATQARSASAAVAVSD